MSLPYDDAISLAMLYHLNSEPWLNKDAYSQPPTAFIRPSDPTAERIPLPETESSPLAELIRGRYSCRNFSQQSLTFESLAAILKSAYGVLGKRRGLNELVMQQRSVPSAGALYPLDLYVIAERVDSLTSGLYRFDAQASSLELLNADLSLVSIIFELMEQSYVANASCLFLMSANLPRTLNKYGPRGYRYILFEAGHVAQNICLLAVEWKLASLCIGGFKDCHINRLLKLNGSTDVCLYAVAIGYPNDRV